MCKRIFADQTNDSIGVPFYKIGTIGGEPDAYISRDLFKQYKKKYNYPQKGEVMITCAGTVGKAIVFDGKDSYFQDSNIVWISNTTSYLSNDYLYYFINRVDWSKLNSTTITRIYNDDLRKLKIAFPSIDEQKKIVQLLYSLDRRIAVQSKLIEQLQSLMGGIMVAHYNNCEKQIVQIKELGDNFTVMNLSKDNLTDEGNDCVLYGELFTTYHCTISEIKSKTNLTTGLTFSQSNDLLFPSSTTVDAVSLIAPSAITVPNVVLGGDMFGLHINERYSNVYLAFLFNYILKQRLAKYAQGSTIIHLHFNDICNAKIEVPNLTDQLTFVELSSKVQQKIATEISMLANLQALKSYLLQQMFI
ncbi:MAG: restriction endonuclease subunit S [Aeriscardovia sp.]|nr:restriction endonuclease subunit S [Aeriscardovia sp.]